MQVVSAVVSFASLLLALVIGLRLLARRGGSERWLGAFFLLYNVLGGGLNIVLFSAWADPSLRLPDDLARPLFGFSTACASAGALALYVFTWQTFHPESRVARSATLAAALLLVAGWALQGTTEGFAILVVPGFGYWLSYAPRTAAIAWVAAASFRWWRMSSRRARLGLVEPLVADRFALWSLWSAIAFLLSFTDPVARLVYLGLTGDAVNWHPEVGQQIIDVAVAISSTLGSVGLGALVLTFFPPPGYRRWVESRAASRA